MKKLCLSQTDKKIAGVCGGIAEYFEINSIIMRLAVVFVALVTGLIPAVVTYLVAMLIIPKNTQHHKVHDIS